MRGRAGNLTALPIATHARHNCGKQRDERDYYESAREFGKYCVEWRQKNHLKSKIIKNAT